MQNPAQLWTGGSPAMRSFSGWDTCKQKGKDAEQCFTNKKSSSAVGPKWPISFFSRVLSLTCSRETQKSRPGAAFEMTQYQTLTSVRIPECSAACRASIMSVHPDPPNTKGCSLLRIFGNMLRYGITWGNSSHRNSSEDYAVLNGGDWNLTQALLNKLYKLAHGWLHPDEGAFPPIHQTEAHRLSGDLNRRLYILVHFQINYVIWPLQLLHEVRTRITSAFQQKRGLKVLSDLPKATK